jgi:16S rRNA processing protein RimM
VGGELKIVIEEHYTEDFLKNERLFIEQKGDKIPYFVETVRGSDAHIIKFEDIDNREVALALQSRKVFLRPDDLIPDAERTLERPEETALQYAYLVGYALTDRTLGTIGHIEEVLEMPQQEMAALHYKSRYTLIPLHPALILAIHPEQKTIDMDLPEGLVE